MDNRKFLFLLPESIEYFRKNAQFDQQQRHNINAIGLQPFKPMKQYQIYFIHCLTPINVVANLIQQANNTNTFSIAFERICPSDQVIFIKIEFVQLEQLKSTVLIFNILHLPLTHTKSFFMIQLLLLAIFSPSKKIYSWCKCKQDIEIFIQNKYLTNLQVQELNIIELQQPFEQWYNKTFIHDKSHLNENGHTKWTISMAIKHIFNEYIYTSNKTTTLAHRINIAAGASYCSAITKIAMVIENDWTIEQLYQYKKFHQK